MKTSPAYYVAEIFESIQGEGNYAECIACLSVFNTAIWHVLGAILNILGIKMTHSYLKQPMN